MIIPTKNLERCLLKKLLYKGCEVVKYYHLKIKNKHVKQNFARIPIHNQSLRVRRLTNTIHTYPLCNQRPLSSQKGYRYRPCDNTREYWLKRRLQLGAEVWIRFLRYWVVETLLLWTFERQQDLSEKQVGDYWTYSCELWCCAYEVSSWQVVAMWWEVSLDVW